jgi:3alpha(or 20beta)-hydroxysteroid dehydrogenase
MFDLTDKIAVITGAASGIGLAASRRFSAAGATVVLADIADASGFAAEMNGHYIRADVSVEANVQDLMAAAARISGRIDICLNNAGIGTAAELRHADTADYEAAFHINTLGAVYGMKHVVDYMPPGSAIVNTASILGVIGYPNCGAYGASKFAIVGLTKIAALEFGSRGIRVNCVCPTSVDTPQLAAQGNGASEAAVFGAMAGVRSLLNPAEVAAAMHFLVADDCPIISGQAINLDGGVTAGVSPTIIGLTDAAYLA